MAETQKIAFWAYALVAAITLPIQLFVRLQQCTEMAGCLLHIAKAILWSVIWPAYWPLYLGWLS